jgi:hypothetical protein
MDTMIFVKAAGLVTGDVPNAYALIRSRKQRICDVEIGASTANLFNLVNLAYYHGQPIMLDPSRERFTGCTGDESWLDVAHHDRWKVA